MSIQTKIRSAKRFSPQLTQLCKKVTSATFLFLLLFLLFGVQYLHASTDNSVSFSWLANSADEDVVGYRLYYGDYSRFNTDGSLKLDFSYRYVIDLNHAEKCDLVYENCTTLKEEELDCSNLYGDKPSCTLKQLSGRKYFSLTAYNYYGESQYTKELYQSFITITPQPSSQPFMPHISILLLKK